MKKQAILAAAILAISCFVISAKYSKSAAQSTVSFKLSAEKNVFSVGEKVILNVEMTNNGGLSGSKDIRCGYLKTYISNDNKDYKEAAAAGGFQIDECEVSLPLNGKLSTKKTLLWNAFANAYNSNKSSSLFQDKITTNYIFSKPGTYFIKVKLGVIDEKTPLIESEPIQITIAQPVGEDLEIWNKIKQRESFAYFLQQGEILSRDTKQRADFRQEIEQIADRYPNSFLADQMRQNLAQYDRNEARRQEYREKLKQQEQP